jgi:formylmethanofuran dehydrogenase subunit E
VIDLASCLRGSGARACFSAASASLQAPAVSALVVPGAPINLAAAVTGSTVTLTWTAPATGDPVASYILEAGSTPGASNLANVATGNAATIFVATGVGAGTYYVRVRAENASGAGAASNEVVVVVGAPPCAAPPNAPTGLASIVTGGTVTLTWNGSSGGCAPTSYVVQAGSGAGLSNLANANTGSTATTFVATGVGNGTYFVRVIAQNAVGQSAASNEVVVVVGCASAPSAPTGLVGSASGATVTLTWSPPAAGCAPASYVVQAGSSPGLSDLANVNTGSTATTFMATGVGSGTYFVRVLAQNAAGQSSPSNEVTVTVAPAVCSFVLSPTAATFAANGGDGAVTVSPSAPSCSWTASVSVPFEESTAVRITSGSSGQGVGQVTYHVDPNTLFGVTRTNQIVVGGLSLVLPAVRHTVTQLPATTGCTFNLLSPATLSFGPSGGTGEVTLSASAATCGWTIDVTSSTEDWVRVGAGRTVVGSGTATFSVASASSSAFVPLPRSGNLGVFDAAGNRIFTVAVSQQ